MRIYFLIIPVIAFLLQSCKGQTKAREIYVKEFDWSFEIPAGFDSVSSSELEKIKNKGAAMIEKTYDTKVEDHTTPIFMVRSDRFNYCEASWQPFDTTTDGDHMESVRAVQKMLYGTYEAQMSKAQLDSSSYEETIDGKVFQTFKVIIIIPDKVRMEVLMHSKLFGNKELTVNMFTVNKEKQKVLLDAWRNSKFEKRGIKKVNRS